MIRNLLHFEVRTVFLNSPIGVSTVLVQASNLGLVTYLLDQQFCVAFLIQSIQIMEYWIKIDHDCFIPKTIHFILLTIIL
jgi:hypothetical protein